MRFWRRLFVSKNHEAELEREIRDHLDLETGDQIGMGLSPQEAKSTALKLFGNPDLIKEDVRQAWSIRWLERLQQDLQYAVRVFLKAPAFTAVTSYQSEPEQAVDFDDEAAVVQFGSMWRQG